MKRLFALFLTACMVMALMTGCGSEGTTTPENNTDTESEQVYTLRINSNMSEADLVECADGVAITQFKEEVERESNGRLKVDLFLNSQLGSGADELITGAETGAFECFNLNAANWGSYTKAFIPVTLPYLFNKQAVLQAYLDGAGGQAISEQVLNDTGMKPMFYSYMGYRTIVNNKRPITKPEDFEGLKMRVLNDANIIKAFELWGASTLTVSYSELYTATQQGLIDGSDGPYTDIITSNRDEVNKYISDINYSYHVGVWAIAQNAYDNLPADLQQIFDTACKNAQATAADNAAYEKVALDQLKANMAYNELDEAGLAAFKESVQPLYEDVKKDLGEDVWNEVLANVATAETEVG